MAGPGSGSSSSSGASPSSNANAATASTEAAAADTGNRSTANRIRVRSICLFYFSPYTDRDTHFIIQIEQSVRTRTVPVPVPVDLLRHDVDHHCQQQQLHVPCDAVQCALGQPRRSRCAGRQARATCRVVCGTFSRRRRRRHVREHWFSQVRLQGILRVERVSDIDG